MAQENYAVGDAHPRGCPCMQTMSSLMTSGLVQACRDKGIPRRYPPQHQGIPYQAHLGDKGAVTKAVDVVASARRRRHCHSANRPYVTENTERRYRVFFRNRQTRTRKDLVEGLISSRESSDRREGSPERERAKGQKDQEYWKSSPDSNAAVVHRGF